MDKGEIAVDKARPLLAGNQQTPVQSGTGLVTLWCTHQHVEQAEPMSVLSASAASVAT